MTSEQKKLGNSYGIELGLFSLGFKLIRYNRGFFYSNSHLGTNAILVYYDPLVHNKLNMLTNDNGWEPIHFAPGDNLKHLLINSIANTGCKFAIAYMRNHKIDSILT